MTVVHTLGHSTRSPEEFVELLRGFRISHLVDIRRYPGSRRHPHFAKEALRELVERHDIRYTHVEPLGGRRPVQDDSPNTYWRNAGFRGYADYMGTDAFTEALEGLIELARRDAAAVMCAEAVPWRCHRNLLADALTARGLVVRHVLGPDRADDHVMNTAARAGADGRLTYPSEPPPQYPLFAP